MSGLGESGFDLSEFAELSHEDKVKVIVGMIVTIILGVISFVFFEVFIRERQIDLSHAWESGTSGFAIIRGFMPLIFLIMIFPVVVISELAISKLLKRSAGLRGMLVLLLLIGGGFTLSVALLTLFDLLFSALPPIQQYPLILVALFIPVITVALTTRVRKIHDYIKQNFG